jgi:hypothetical protein
MMGYYQGDYYRGDPGFLSALGSIAKAAVGFIPGVGPTLSKGIDAISAAKAAKTAARIAVPAAAGAAATGVVATGLGKLRKVGAIAKAHPVLTGAGAAGVGALVGAATEKGVAGMLNGGRMRRHRRMNPLNPRALRKALRRAHSFAKFAKKVIRVEHRFKKPRGTWPRGHRRKRR